MSKRPLSQSASRRMLSLGEILFVSMMTGWLLAVVAADESAPSPDRPDGRQMALAASR